jgi:hypothetical protein
MDALTRRGHIKTTRNPDEHLDYVVTLVGLLHFEATQQACQVNIRYVPDKLIILHDSFAMYLGALGGTDWTNLEEAATAVLEDLGNELVARWIQITAFTESEDAPSTRGHQVVLVDKQPQWKYAELLARLDTI